MRRSPILPPPPGYPARMMLGRVRTRRLRALLMCTCILVAAAAGGCVTSGPDGHRDSPPRNYRVADGEWPFWPQRMRIHPLSHFVKDRSSGDLLLEVRIELFDPEGDTCKAVGRMDIDLFDADAAKFMAEAVGSWTTDLSDLEVNQAHYDEVTRTYLFRLEVAEVPVPELPELRAYFTSGDGRHLQATYRPRPPDSE